MLKQPLSPPRRQRREEDRKLAKKWDVSDRTIRTWRGAGAPLDNPQAMQRWVLENRGDYSFQPTSLPPDLDHSNLLRHFVEDAVSHFLFVATSNTLDALISSLVEEEGLDPKKARSLGVLVWYGLLNQLHHWTTGDRYNDHLKAEGTSLDGALKRILPGWKEMSFPPETLRPQPVPACIQAAFEANGQEVRRFVRLDHQHGLAFTDSD